VSEQFTILGDFVNCSGSPVLLGAAKPHEATALRIDKQRRQSTVFRICHSTSSPSGATSVGYPSKLLVASPDPSSTALSQANFSNQIHSTRRTTRRPQHHQQRPYFFWFEAQLVNPGLAGCQDVRMAAAPSAAFSHESIVASPLRAPSALCILDPFYPLAPPLLSLVPSTLSSSRCSQSAAVRAQCTLSKPARLNNPCLNALDANREAAAQRKKTR
jgi:hypothetical protein